MSRSGYIDDCDGWDLIKWRGMVASSIRGRRGQALLREMLAALDAMPIKRLIAEELQTPEGVCALGCVGAARGIKLDLDPEDHDALAQAFNVARPLIQEIEFINDDEWRLGAESPEERWSRVRAWVAKQVRS